MTAPPFDRGAMTEAQIDQVLRVFVELGPLLQSADTGIGVLLEAIMPLAQSLDTDELAGLLRAWGRLSAIQQELALCYARGTEGLPPAATAECYQAVHWYMEGQQRAR